VKEQTVRPMIIGPGLFVFVAVLAPLSMGEVVVPEGYREWVHVGPILIPQGSSLYHLSGGMEHIYANEKAWKGMKGGTAYPEGAVLISDLLDVLEQNHAMVEGPREMTGSWRKIRRDSPKQAGGGSLHLKGKGKNVLPRIPGMLVSLVTNSRNNPIMFSAGPNSSRAPGEFQIPDENRPSEKHPS
jgi:hypothetical protein